VTADDPRGTSARARWPWSRAGRAPPDPTAALGARLDAAIAEADTRYAEARRLYLELTYRRAAEARALDAVRMARARRHHARLRGAPEVGEEAALRRAADALARSPLVAIGARGLALRQLRDTLRARARVAELRGRRAVEDALATEGVDEPLEALRAEVDALLGAREHAGGAAP
jgi:hypothetical protein